MPAWLVPEFREVVQIIIQSLPAVGAALAVLVFGWLCAVVLRMATFAALRRTKVDDKLAALLGFQTGGERGARVEGLLASVVYWICLAVVFALFFNALGIQALTHPFVTMLTGFSNAVPYVAKAALLGLAGFAAAMLVRLLIVKALARIHFDHHVARLVPEAAPPRPSGAPDAPAGERTSKEPPPRSSMAGLIGNVAYGFLIVVTLVTVLEALDIGVLARPLSSAIEMMTTYLPRVMGAGLILLLGYLLARLVRTVSSDFLERLGVDRAGSRLGLRWSAEGFSPSKLFGTALFALILIQAAASALGRLQIEEVSGPATRAIAEVYTFAPRLLVGLLLLAVGIGVGRVVGNIVASFAAALGLNALIDHIGLGGAPPEKAADEAQGPGDIDAVITGQRRLRTPADVAGLAASLVVVLLFARQALSTMHLDTLSSMLDGLIAFLPQVAAAVVVLIAGLWAGRWARSRIEEMTARSKDPLVRVLGRVAHVAIVVFASAVALQHLGVGRELLALAFGLLFGAICLAFALAAGLGGRDVAARILSKEYEKRQSTLPPVR